jgi:hypothetical protein
MNASGVLPKRAPLTKDSAKSAVSLALARLTYAHGIGAVADHAGCSARTIAEAKAEHSLPELHSIINLLALDATVLDELLAPLGLRVVPADITAGDWGQLLADVTGTGAELAAALVDQRVDHQERARVLNRARPMVQALAGHIAQHDRERAAV